MDAHKTIAHPTLEQILEADAWARREAAKHEFSLSSSPA
jgi:hypothetical protein